MCLINPKKVNTDNDIICYKKLCETEEYNFSKVKSGDSFTALIEGIEVSGKISIFKDKYYFCTNDVNLDGSKCPNKFGYKYSWVLDGYIEDVSVNEEPLPFELFYITPYQGAPVKIGETYTSKIYFNQNEAIEEALHSFKELKNAFLDCQNENEVIVKCIIPKGSICYLGRFNAYKDSYASNALTYLEVIKPSSMTFEEFKSKFLSE